MNTKNRKITVLLEESQFERFDTYCDKNGHKKSSLICKLIGDFLEANDKKENIKSSKQNS
jgi:metal-responsive CopG/Arc/MetJ family transcriptional regulator